MDKPVTGQPPGLFSPAFHVRFFPSVLRRTLFPGKKGYESPFARHFMVEWMIILALSVLACVFGYAAALGKGSVAGWAFALLGTGGLLFVIVSSIRSQAGTRPSFDNFRAGVFFFLLLLGFTAGLGIGHANQVTYGTRLLCGLAGAVTGYFVGILGGLWIQYLGWLSETVNLLAWVALVGMVVVDILLLL
jgi:hypothetical protein